METKCFFFVVIHCVKRHWIELQVLMRIMGIEPDSLDYGLCSYQKMFRNGRDSGIYGRPLNLFMGSMVPLVILRGQNAFYDVNIVA